jgi:hypothetical protein
MIETAPLAIALFDARSLRVLQLNQMAGRFFGPTPPACRGPPEEQGCQRARLRAGRPGLSRAARREWCWQREVPMPAQPPGRGAHVWDVRIVPLEGQGGAAPQLLLVASDVTEQRAAEQARCRRRSRSARCWCAKCTTASRTTCRAWPACCSRTRQRRPEVAGDLTARRWPGAGDRPGLRPAGRRQRAAARWSRVRGHRHLGAAHLRPRSRSRWRQGWPTAGAARGRIDPDRADPQRAADQRHQAWQSGEQVQLPLRCDDEDAGV